MEDNQLIFALLVMDLIADLNDAIGQFLRVKIITQQCISNLSSFLT